MRAKILTALVTGAALLTIGYPAQAELQGRDLDGDPATFEAYYDTVLNVTWLADMDYARTSGYDADGHMNWVTANTWAASLNYYGVTGWRLPEILDTGGAGCAYFPVYDGTDCGFNVDTANNGTTYSAMAYIFYDQLGNTPRWTTSGTPNPTWGFTNPGPFRNTDSRAWWSSTSYITANNREAWFFNFGDGSQVQVDKNGEYHAWPVHDGDVSPPDADGDGVPDSADNCLAIFNPDQTDNEADGIGDACDHDDDNDGVLEPNDNCPLVVNPSQADVDGDGDGDACDADLDGDGVANESDNCPMAANIDQTDTDGDGEGDECDLNDDGDERNDDIDNCPAVPNNGQDDLDDDKIGDVCDADLDGDGVANESDNCPIDPNVAQDDADGDGLGDACDSDDDADGVADTLDNCPLVANLDQSDVDSDGAGDACDSDLDGDGTANGADNCPQDANPDQRNMDGDRLGDACDPDIDGDAVANAADACAGTPGGTVTDATGCSIAQLVPCSGPAGTVLPWRNHGKYVSATAQAVNRFLEAGLLTQAEADSAMSSAAGSSCGR